MSTRQIKRPILLAALALCLGAVMTSTIDAKPEYFERAKELGYPAQDCTYCHTKPTGGAGWNARGTWLRGQKKTRRAKEVDISWLKDYQE
jgi:hypothetical protein